MDEQDEPLWRVIARRRGLLSREPTSVQDFLALGRRLRDSENCDRDRFVGTLSAFQEAVFRDPDMPEARLWLARAHLYRGEYEKALVLLRALVGGPASSPDAERTLQEATEIVEQMDAALERARAASEMRPADPTLHKEVGRICAYALRWQECLVAFQRAVALSLRTPTRGLVLPQLYYSWIDRRRRKRISQCGWVSTAV